MATVKICHDEKRAKIMQKIISILRLCLPEAVRRLPALQRLKNRLNQRFLGHDGIYNQEYYQNTVEVPAAQSAVVICESIIKRFAPESMVDVGCGTGALMAAFKTRNVRAKGFEYSEAALEFCRRRNLDVTKFDLEKDILNQHERFDVAVSMEVAEHLPKAVAAKYVALLAQLSDRVVLTAAAPGQGGQDHVNEQPPSYWIAIFANHKMSLDESLTKDWKDEWQKSGTVAKWYYENLMVFRKV